MLLNIIVFDPIYLYANAYKYIGSSYDTDIDECL
jgi:hypothetical protein